MTERLQHLFLWVMILRVNLWQKMGLGLGVAVLLGYPSLSQPQWLLRLVSPFAPGAVFFIETEQPVIALTIDDGPHGDTTGEILDVLGRHGVKATFFLLSNALLEHQTVVQRLISDGHELGHHMTEDESSLNLPFKDFRTKFAMADEALSVYGTVRWFRPGMGLYNQAMLNEVEAQGYQLVLGSLFPYDTHLPSVRFSQWFVLNNLDPGDILVLHDGPKNRGERTVELLDYILPRIQQRGYRIVTLSDLETYGKE